MAAELNHSTLILGKILPAIFKEPTNRLAEAPVPGQTWYTAPIENLVPENKKRPYSNLHGPLPDLILNLFLGVDRDAHCHINIGM